MSHLTLVIDCAEPERLAEFWCAALGYRIAGGMAQYRSIKPSNEPRYSVGLKIIFQAVPEAKAGKNRLHLDLDLSRGESLADEIERLTTLGATSLTGGQHQEFGLHWETLADPEGNEFCVVGPPPG